MNEITVVCNICVDRFPDMDTFRTHWKVEHEITYGWNRYPLLRHHPNGFSDSDEKTIQRWMRVNHLPIESRTWVGTVNKYEYHVTARFTVRAESSSHAMVILGEFLPDNDGGIIECRLIDSQFIEKDDKNGN